MRSQVMNGAAGEGDQSCTLAVVVLTHNEEIHIARALDAVASIASEIFVVDSFSTDRTVELARSRGATVIQHEFINYARQFQWALENAPIRSKWVMRLDADEVIEAALAAEISEKLPLLPEGVAGINLRRKHIFLDRWIRHGSRYPLVMLRIWRHGQGRIENRWMDEHMVVWGGRIITFDNDFADHNLKGLMFFTDKHNKYATREAIDVLNQRLKFLDTDDRFSLKQSSAQAALKRTIKEALYNRIPFQLSAFLYFAYRYVFKLGFLDGPEGLIYHCLQGFWYRFLVGAKTFELERAIAGLREKREIRAELARLTGLKLEL
jgi:glycosyltransferase involved in cell wall biosynthesis